MSKLVSAPPLDRGKQTRDEIHREVCEQGYDGERRTFAQYYGSEYDVRRQRQVGNFPQAFSHLTLIGAATAIAAADAKGPAA